MVKSSRTTLKSTGWINEKVNASPKTDYDVVVIGGALSGAATALMLLREQPGLRLLIIEKSPFFKRRVGEATVEVSTYFLTRVLGLMQHLNEQHLVKQGMRFWFTNDQAKTIEECSEIGGRYTARVPAFQVDRAVLDEEVLRRACAAGATLLRPATVQSVELNCGGAQRIAVRSDGQAQTLSTRWVVDASGVAALLARNHGWWRANTDHPTAAVWARWRGVKDWDGWELARKYPMWAKVCYGIRGTATNHLVGPGWWAWCIPLKGGDVSVGVVFDQRMVDWPEQGPLADRLKEFLCRHPVGREILSDAECIEGDVHLRRNLPYYSTTFAGDGFVIVGDAAGFLDPFYSPGMDWISFTTVSATALILAERAGENLEAKLARHNRDFAVSYQRWFQAVYQDKYEYMGDYELMRLAFLLDLGLYYLGVAAQPFKRGLPGLRETVFSTPPSLPFFHFMRAYNRRFAMIARGRRKRGTWGYDNDRHRFLFGGFTFARSSVTPILSAVMGWLWLEAREGWRTWFRKPSPSQPARNDVEYPSSVQGSTQTVTETVSH
jgi:flavin-dependent dehydrogenase